MTQRTDLREQRNMLMSNTSRLQLQMQEMQDTEDKKDGEGTKEQQAEVPKII